MELSNTVYQDVPSYRVAGVRNSENPPVVPTSPPKHSYTPVFILIILFLLTTNTIFFCMVVYLLAGDTSQLTQTQTQLPATYFDTSEETLQNEPLEDSVTATTQKIHTPISPENPSFTSIYSGALDQASDLKKKADLATIASAMIIYSMEHDFELPDNFPDHPKCIGTDARCFDLYTLLVPTLIDRPYIDTGATEGNSGYLIGTSHDGTTSFILQAKGTNGEMIEVRK